MTPLEITLKSLVTLNAESQRLAAEAESAADAYRELKDSESQLWIAAGRIASDAAFASNERTSVALSSRSQRSVYSALLAVRRQYVIIRTAADEVWARHAQAKADQLNRRVELVTIQAATEAFELCLFGEIDPI